MTKLFVSLFKRTAMLLIISGLTIFMVSCGDDEDKVDCGKITNEIIQTIEGIVDAIEAEDCEGIESAYGKFITQLRNGKSCAFVEGLVADDGYNNVEELIADLEQERDFILEDLACD